MYYLQAPRLFSVNWYLLLKEAVSYPAQELKSKLCKTTLDLLIIELQEAWNKGGKKVTRLGKQGVELHMCLFMGTLTISEGTGQFQAGTVHR